MINELVILFTDKQQAELIKRAEAEGYQDDLEYLQLQLDCWLSDNKSLGGSLTEGMLEARLSHTEK